MGNTIARVHRVLIDVDLDDGNSKTIIFEVNQEGLEGAYIELSGNGTERKAVITLPYQKGSMYIE